MVMLARLLAAGIYIPDEPEQNTQQKEEQPRAIDIKVFKVVQF